MKHLDSLTQQLKQLSDRLQHPNSCPKLVDSSSKISKLVGQRCLVPLYTTSPDLLIYATKKIAQGDRTVPPTGHKKGVVSRVSVQQVQPGRKRCVMHWVRGWVLVSVYDKRFFCPLLTCRVNFRVISNAVTINEKPCGTLGLYLSFILHLKTLLPLLHLKSSI